MSKDLLRQLDNMKKILPEYTERLFSEGMEEIDFNDFKNIETIYMVGSGDSYSSALSLKDTIRNYTGVSNVIVLDVMSFTRFLSEEKLRNVKNTALIAISNGGETARVIEAIKRGNKYNLTTILITNNLDSRAAKEAKYNLYMDLPELEYSSPGLISYYSSSLTLYLFSLRLGENKEFLTEEAVENIKNEIISVFKKYLDKYDEIKEVAQQVAKDIKDKDFYDFIADGQKDTATAYFNSAKFVECSGKLVNLHDSEEWCHVNTFLKNPTQLPTFLLTDVNSPSYNRIAETAGQAAATNRKLYIIGNVNAEDFSEETTIIPVHKSEKFDEINVLFDYLPLTLVAGYVASENNDVYFNDQLHLDAQTIRNSKIITI